MNNTADRMKIIVEAAAKLFAEKGYHKTTVDEIAENSGVVRGTVLHYFSCKDRLFNAVLDTLENEFTVAASEIAGDKSVPAEEAVLKLVDMCIDEFSSLKPESYSEETDARVKRYYIDALRLRLYYRAAELLTGIVKRGGFNAPDPKSRAESVMFAVFGIIGAQLSKEKTSAEINAVLKNMLGIERKKK